MLHYVIYVLLVLLHQLADCKPVEKTDETLENLYKIIKNETSCSLDINPIVDDKKFIELCGDKTVPDLTKISEDQFLFDFQDYLCYSVYHNVRALCHSGHNQSSYTPQPFETEPDKFCSSIPEINITDKCNTWLEGDMGTDDCNLVSKVNTAIMKNNKDLCSKECIKADKLDPMCKSLVGTSLILASVKNNTVKNTSEVNLPSSPREIIEKSPEESKASKKPEESSDNLPSPPREIIEKNPEEVRSTKKSEEASGGKMDASKGPENETVTKGVKLETVAGSSEAQSLKEEKSEKMSSVTEEKEKDEEDKQEKKESGTEEEEKEEVEEEADEDEKITSGTQEKEEEEVSDEIVPNPSVTEDLASVSEPVTKSTETEEESDKDKAEEEHKDALPNTSFQGSINSGSEGEGESNFFSYFMMLSLFAIVAYLVFHNKRQILALVLEGRKQQGGRRRSGGREYRKLDSSGEEREMIY